MTVEKIAEEAVEAAVGGVGSFLGGWQVYLIGGAMLLAAGGFAGWRVTSWKDAGEITSLRSQLATAQANEATGWNSYDACQASLEKVKKDGDARTAAADDKLKALETAKAASDRRAAGILASKPKPGQDLCQAADELILNAAGGGK